MSNEDDILFQPTTAARGQQAAFPSKTPPAKAVAAAVEQLDLEPQAAADIGAMRAASPAEPTASAGPRPGAKQARTAVGGIAANDDRGRRPERGAPHGLPIGARRRGPLLQRIVRALLGWLHRD